MSGRPAPESVVMERWVSKSTRSMSPAASTTLRSWVSPHTPRVLFERNADARDSAVERSRSSFSAAILSCWLSSPCCWWRCVSSAVTLACMSVSVCFTGARACSTLLSAASRASRSRLLDPLAFDDLAVLGAGGLDLLAETAGGRLERCEFGAQLRLHLLLFGEDSRLLGCVGSVHTGDLGLVPRLDERRVFGHRARAGRGLAPLREEPCAERAECGADDEADDEQQDLHASSVAGAADIDGAGASAGRVSATTAGPSGRARHGRRAARQARSPRTAPA